MDNENKKEEKFGEMKITGANNSDAGVSVNFRSAMPQFGGGNSAEATKEAETFKMPMPMPEFGGGVDHGTLNSTAADNAFEELANFADSEAVDGNSGVVAEDDGKMAENDQKTAENTSVDEDGPILLRSSDKKKIDKKVFVAVMIGLVLVCGGGVAAWQILGNKQEKPVVKTTEDTENRENKNSDIKVPDTDEEVLAAAKESLEKEKITVENLKIEKKDKNLAMVSYAGGVAIIELDGITNPVLTKGKSLTDYESLYGGGKVSAEFLHGKFEDRVFDALAREQKVSFDKVKAENEVKLTSMDGEKSEFVQVAVREKAGGGYVVFLKQNEKDGRYEFVAGGQAITEENLKAMKEKGFPEKYWKKQLEDIENNKKDDEKKKEEEEKKKKEEQEKAKNSEAAFKEKIYKGLAEHYKESVEKIKKEHSISLLSNDNDGRFINVRYGNCDEEKDDSCGYNSVKMIYNTATSQYVYIASSKPLKVEELKKMKDLSFPEKYWKDDLEKLQKRDN